MTTSGNIFISYRRDDEPGFVHAMYGQLEQAFPRERLFIDVDSIQHGKDFVKVLEANVSKCEVLLAVIGKNWLSEIDTDGKDVRLNNPGDFVRLEIASALQRDINVKALSLCLRCHQHVVGYGLDAGCDLEQRAEG
jgi:hypothetical protein